MSWQPPPYAPQPGSGGLRPLGVGEVLDASFRVYRQAFAKLVVIAAIGIVPAQILSTLLLTSSSSDNLTTERTDAFGNTTLEVQSDDLWRFVAAFALTILVTLIGSILVTAATTHLVASVYAGGRTPSVAESLRRALAKFLPLLGLTLLVALALLGCGVLVLLGVLGGGAIAALGVFFGGLVWIGAATYLYVSWSVAAPALMVEDAGVIGAMRRSLQLVRGRWWPMFGILLLVTILTSIINQIIATPFSLAGGGASGMFTTGATDYSATGLILVGLGGIVAGLITQPFAAIVTVLLYYDLRVRKEGLDIQLLAAGLGTTPSATAIATGRPGTPPDPWSTQNPWSGGAPPPAPPPPAPPPPPSPTGEWGAPPPT